MSDKSCFFIGHRKATDDLRPALTAEIERHIAECGVTTFIVGGYGGFDRLVSSVLVEMKQLYPGITLLRLIPYHPTECPVEMPEGFDSTYYPPGMETVPRKFAIVKANQYVVDHVDYLISYVWHPASNARNLIEYAASKEKQGKLLITNLEKPTL